MSALAPGERPTVCPGCATAYHADCWAENHGCATYGCPHVPPTEGLQPLEIAPSYWGQEEKACPSCGATIRAAAVRCRACGATFEGARPEDGETFRRRQDQARLAPGLRRLTIVLFVLSIVPCTAPLGGATAGVWYSLRREDFKALPAVYLALARMAIAVGLGQTVMAALAVALYAVMHR
jgi:hypothetical protein